MTLCTSKTDGESANNHFRPKTPSSTYNLLNVENQNFNTRVKHIDQTKL